MTKKAKSLAISIATILLLGPVFYVWTVDRASDRQLERAQADLRELGYPVTLGEFLAKAPPDKENAAILYAQVRQSLTPTRRNAYLLRELSLPGNREIQFLKESESWLKPIGAFGARPHYWPKRDYHKVDDFIAQDVLDMEIIARYVGQMAVWEAQKGNEARSIWWLRTQATIAGHMVQDPLLFGGMEGYRAFQSRDRAALLCALAHPKPEFRKALRDEVKAHPAKFDMRNHIGSEVLNVASFKAHGRPFSPEYEFAFRIANLPPLIRRWRSANTEQLAATAKSAADGLSLDEVVALDRLSQKRMIDDHVAERAMAHTFPISDAFSTEGVKEVSTLTLTALNLMDDPKASIPEGVMVERRDTATVLLGTAFYVMFDQRFVRSGTRATWRGFGP